MAVGLVYKIPGATTAVYDAVNAKLNIDMTTGRGPWPDGLVSHAAGEADGSLYIMEVWESREAQGRWMSGRLGQAIQESGVNIAPPELTWIDLVSYHTPGKVPA